MLHPFAYRRAEFRPAHQFLTPEDLIAQLHAVMDIPKTPDVLMPDPVQMIYAGELLEELRHFREHGSDALDAAYPALVEHAAAKHRLDLLLCLKDATPAPEHEIRIHERGEALLQTVPPEEIFETEGMEHEVAMMRAALYAPPLPVPPQETVNARLQRAEEALIECAKTPSNFAQMGAQAMLGYRITRLTRMIHSEHHCNASLDSVVDSLAEEKHGTLPMQALGMCWAIPGLFNHAFERAGDNAYRLDEQALKEELRANRSDPFQLPATRALRGDHPDFIRPSAYLPVEECTNEMLMQQALQLAEKHPLSHMDPVRMGEVLEVLQNQRHDEGRRLMQRESKRLIKTAVAAENIHFLIALGQVTTPLDEPLKTMKAIEPLLEAHAAMLEDWPESMHLEGSCRIALPHACEESLHQMMKEDTQEWDRSLLGILIQRYRFFSEFDVQPPLQYDLESLRDRAEEKRNWVSMQALGYAMTEPGARLINTDALLMAEDYLRQQPDDALFMIMKQQDEAAAESHAKKHAPKARIDLTKIEAQLPRGENAMGWVERRIKEQGNDGVPGADRSWLN